jgi:aminopeptidase N
MFLNKCHCFLILLYVLFSCNPTRNISDHSAEKYEEKEKIIREEIPEAPPIIKKEDLSRKENLTQEKERGIMRYEASRERKFDLLHTSLDLQFDYDRQIVMGKAQLSLKPYFYDQEVLEIDAKDFDIHDVWLLEGDKKKPLALTYNQQKSTIFLPGVYTAEDTLEIGISYTARPNENSGLGSEAIGGNKGLYFINPERSEGKPVQIWTQGETEHNSKWFPTIDSPNERATHDIRLTVEDKFTTISNGRLLSQTSNGDGSRTDHWEMDQPHAPYLTAIVVGEFAEVSDSIGDLPLTYFVEEVYRTGAKKVFENTPEMITFFSGLLGVEFPWQKYDQIVVRDFVSGAMENTTASIFMEALNLDEREAIDSEWDYIIAHELFHQWFGNYVTLESWSNLPLNEAFADYSEYLWMEHHEGKDRADMHHLLAMEDYFSEAKEKQVDLIRFEYDHMEDMFDRHSYAKGGRVLHMLRRYLGDEAFFASLNYYLEQHAFSSVEIHNLRLAFENVTGKDLNWFFNQWFLSSGHPILDIKVDMSQPDNILLTIKQKQDLQTTPLHQLPFTVTWYENGQRTEKDFTLTQGTQQFALENGGHPDLVLFDESMELLALKDTYRGREHFENQFAMAEAGIARYEALDSLANKYSFDQETGKIFLTALKDGFPSIRELALSKIQSNLESTPLTADGEKMIMDIAEKDPENTVRAGAIELLNKVDRDKYAPLFQKWVNDSSYYVAGAALFAYLDNENNPQRDQIADRFLETDNIRMIVSLADYFTRLPDPTKGDWFHSKLEKLTGESLYYFIGYYGDYFARREEMDQEVTINNLYGIAKNNSLESIRLAAFQALFGFIDEEGVHEKAKSLFAEEKDGRVREYQGFFLEGVEEVD